MEFLYIIFILIILGAYSVEKAFIKANYIQIKRKKYPIISQIDGKIICTMSTTAEQEIN